MIRKAQLDEIDELMAITQACANDMISNGIFQWNEHYPNREAFVEDVENGELFVLSKEDSIVGCIVISYIKDKEYDDVKWLTPDAENIYIHRLAIHPAFQGQGLARRMMDFAEDFAKEAKATSVRLDTFSQNKRNQRFYEARGYTRLGDVYFPKQSDFPFHCYELPLRD